jgi:hypothetical protein
VATRGLRQPVGVDGATELRQSMGIETRTLSNGPCTQEGKRVSADVWEDRRIHAVRSNQRAAQNPITAQNGVLFTETATREAIHRALWASGIKLKRIWTKRRFFRENRLAAQPTAIWPSDTVRYPGPLRSSRQGANLTVYRCERLEIKRLDR